MSSVVVALHMVLCACWIVSLSQGQKKQLYEGDSCNQTSGRPWACKTIKECPKAIELLKKGGRPEMCGFKGTDPVVCCEPEDNVPSTTPVGIKSKEHCKEYAEAVFIQVPDLIDGGVTKFDTCGWAKRLKRITEGVESASREFPHIALLGYQEPNKTSWLAGGSLISDRFVLTAAHAAKTRSSKGDAKIVRLGDFNVQTETDEEMRVAQPTEYEVTEIFIHPEYKPPSLYNDIALLKLNSSVRFTEFIRPICLHTQHELDSSSALAAGWGATSSHGKGSDTLLKVSLKIYLQKECVEFFKHQGSSTFQNGIEEATMVCAGDPEHGRDTCKGDSGMPLQLRLEDPYCMYSQVGVTSFGKGCGSDTPSVYTRVSHYVPWIESIVWPTGG